MTNFLEELRANATGRGHHRIHPHRRALRKAMIGKAFGTCAGCVAIAMTPHAMTPVVLAAMAGICLLVTEGEPNN